MLNLLQIIFFCYFAIINLIIGFVAYKKDRNVLFWIGLSFILWLLVIVPNIDKTKIAFSLDSSMTSTIILIIIVFLKNKGFIKCTHCSEEIKKDAKICKHCGSEVEVSKKTVKVYDEEKSAYVTKELD